MVRCPAPYWAKPPVHLAADSRTAKEQSDVFIGRKEPSVPPPLTTFQRNGAPGEVTALARPPGAFKTVPDLR